jgi:hypothetical protein
MFDEISIVRDSWLKVKDKPSPKKTSQQLAKAMRLLNFGVGSGDALV